MTCGATWSQGWTKGGGARAAPDAVLARAVLARAVLAASPSGEKSAWGGEGGGEEGGGARVEGEGGVRMRDGNEGWG